MRGKKKNANNPIVGRLREFAEALERNEPVTERHRTHRIVLDLRPTRYDSELVKKTRKLLDTTQALFAQLLGVKVKTVQAWEQGYQAPSEMACRFMDEIRATPSIGWTGFEGR